MYNCELNRIWVDKIREKVAGKRVLLVGNALTMFSSIHHGDIVDDYDYVLRFGKGFPENRYKKYLGEKTNAWFFGASRAACYKHYNDNVTRILSISQINAYDSNAQNLAIPKILFDKNFQIYRDYCLTGSLNYIKEVFQDVYGGEETTARLSQGVQAVHFFDKRIRTQTSIDLIGFDFFGSGMVYNYSRGGSSGALPKEHIVASWHCPLISDSFVKNPHASGANDDHSAHVEERFIRKCSSIDKIHEMPKEVNVEEMTKVLQDIRSNESTILQTFSR